MQTQAVAQLFATRFNAACLAAGLAARVRFNPAGVVTIEGWPEPLACEPYLEGDFVKHNDNEGHVAEPTLALALRRMLCSDLATSAEDAADCAAAFSYFSYVDSGGALVVCDIQGVGLLWTDPQIHTVDGRGYGLGNLGQEGIDRFLSAHRHGPMSRRLGLHRRRPAPRAPGEDPACGVAQLAQLSALTPPPPPPHPSDREGAPGRARLCCVCDT